MGKDDNLFGKWIQKQEQEGRVEKGLDIYRKALPPIPRSTWSELPEQVRLLLEKEHGYNHYNPEKDVIESKILYLTHNE